MKETLDELISQAVRHVNAKTPEERKAMFREQMASVIVAEGTWPAPRYRWVNGVKVYESYADYCS